jgi:hypothetical protein
LPALSVRQPWAWAILEAGKDIENRSWSTDYRGPLLIHAGQQEAPDGFEQLEALGLVPPAELQTGGIVGRVELVDVVRDHESPWAIEDHWHWVLRDPLPLPFRAAPGRLGLFSP